MSNAATHGRSGESSLEHSFTNIFAITDCSGIHYKKYTLKVEKEYKDVLDDPIVKSFVLCQKNSVMSAWVRSKKDSLEQVDPCMVTKHSRELWVFWYGNGDFPNSESCILPDLRESDRGNWRQGLSYETRTVLFRALHNVLERCLVSKGFIRLGKWFIQPYKSNCSEDYAQYSVSFSFFLHGESTVCASLDLRRHPLLRRVGSKHIFRCSRMQKPIPVVLAPYGISAELIGPSSHVGTDGYADELETWCGFYPLRSTANFTNGDDESMGVPNFATSCQTPQNSRTHNQQRFSVPHDKRPLFKGSTINSDATPSFVDVIIGRFRMRYPSCFVLITDKQVAARNQTTDVSPTGHQPKAIVSNSSHHISRFMCNFSVESSNRITMDDQKLHSFWRIPSTKRTISADNSIELLSTGLPCCNLLFDVHRIGLADQSLLLSCLHYGLSIKRPRLELNNTNEINRDESNGCVQNAEHFNLSGSRTKICDCPRLSAQQQTSAYTTAHLSDCGLRHALRKFINQNDRLRSNKRNHAASLSSFIVSHDPLMPTLSPQPACLLATCSASCGSICKRNNEILSDYKVEHNADPAPLKSFTPPSLSTRPAPELAANPQKNMITIPNGLIASDRSRTSCNLNSYQLAKPPLLISVPKELQENHWLWGQSNTHNQGDIQKPDLQLDVPDLIELEDYYALRTASANCVRSEYLATDEINTSVHNQNYSTMDPFRVVEHTTDGDRNNLSLHREQVTIAPEISVDRCDLEPPIEHSNNSHSIETVPASQPPLSGSTTSILSRTLGFLPRMGMSLASSSGSGSIGPAELALMLPTPPSHDAPQPSPVDGVTSSSSTLNASNTIVSRSNHSLTSSANSPIPTSLHDAAEAYNAGTSNLSLPLAHLRHVAKQSCIQDYHYLNLDPHQDWSFTKPCAAYYGVSSNYQLSRSSFLSPLKCLPLVHWAYDHRAQRQKLPLNASFSDFSWTNAISSRPSPYATSLSRGPYESVSPRRPISPSAHRDPGSDRVKHSLPQPLTCASAFCGDSTPHGLPAGLVFNDPHDDLCERLSNSVETNSILFNVLLSDSMLNLFKDHNFDSCNICECTSSVLGSEVDLYLSNCAPNLTTSGTRTNRSSLGSVASGGAGFVATDLVGGSAFAGSSDCKCGFSAVRNQRYVVNGNLFFEDEVEVTNLRVCLGSNHRPRSYSRSPVYRKQPRWWNASMSSVGGRLTLLKHLAQCSYNEFFVRQLTGFLTRTNAASPLKNLKENFFEFDDICTLVTASLYEASGYANDGYPDIVEQFASVHPSFVLEEFSKIPENDNDQIRLLSTLRPWLQEAISSTRLLESNYTVDGPLSWKAFHQLAGRGSDETSEPQPIPLLRIGGVDKEHTLISPFAIRDWDRLSLSPLSCQKQIAYAVVVPGLVQPASSSTDSGNHISQSPLPPHKDRHVSDEENLLERSLAAFFNELSITYENCRLGQHLPYYQPELNQPQTAFILVDPVEDAPSTGDQRSVLKRLYEALFECLQDPEHVSEAFINSLRSYLLSACSTVLTALHDRGVSVNRRSTRGSGKCPDVTNPFPPFSQSNADVHKFDRSIKDAPKGTKIVGHSSKNPQNGQGPLTTSLDTSAWNSSEDTYLIIYLLNPFSQLCDTSPELTRAVTQGFLECGHLILTALPTSWQPRANIQLLPMEQITSDYLWRLRSISLAVYSSVNRYIEPTLINANRTLTGLGPAAEKETISNEKEVFHRRAVHAPPFVLAGDQNSARWDLPPADPFCRSSVLFVAYCLSQDQQWLLASFTDECGSLLDQTMINVSVPSMFFNEIEKRRTQSSTANGQHSDTLPTHLISPRRIGLARLWDYIINLLSRTSNPWRLVIGRIGRLGHGELKGWNSLLGRKSLQEVNRFFRDHCSVCNASASIPSHTGASTGSKATLNLINNTNGPNSCTHELPSLISACLTSLEPQSTFRVYPGLGLSSEDGFGAGGGSGAGGTIAGTVGSALAGNVSSSGAAGVTGTLNSASASSFAIRTMMLVGNEMATDIPSSTHILVFPTSTSASGPSEHDATELDYVMNGMNLLDLFVSGNNGLGDLDAPGNPAVAMFDEFDNPAGLEFGFTELSPTVASGAVNDHCAVVGHNSSALGEPSGAVLSHPDYANSLRENRDHERVSDVAALHGMQNVGMNLDPSLFDSVAKSSNTRRASGGGSTSGALLNTMPHGLADRPDEVTNLMQQPLAMGYYISTAPTGPLPPWFWASCPHSSLQFPVCLKSALHIQTSLIGFDDAAAVGAAAASASGPTNGGAADRPKHLLDSTSTCDVLRYVLEAYNALSWLTMNPTTNDRRSCLPIHMLVLSQLYQSVEVFT